ncbi:MAG: hypothetical protein KF749_00940 [Bacteroidetes bacterium]|nr:hypothetical protein [Bacteroidota bacterium]MCW5897283.1 hypothetical protein [Bacteroidota bacterium]
MKQLDYVLSNEKEVLAFIRSYYPMYHLSNIFFRDVQYGIQKMFERRGERLNYAKAEEAARAFVEKLERNKILNRIDNQSWVLNYPEYKKPTVTPAAPAKPAPGAAPAKSPASTTPRAPLPPLGGAKPALPPLSSAKPAAGAKPALPPLSSSKPVGGAKPGLPPLSSSKPALAAPGASEQPAPSAAPQAKAVQPAAESPAQPPAVAPTTPATGQKKTLPPLKGNYTPAGKK